MPLYYDYFDKIYAPLFLYNMASGRCRINDILHVEDCLKKLYEELKGELLKEIIIDCRYINTIMISRELAGTLEKLKGKLLFVNMNEKVRDIVNESFNESNGYDHRGTDDLYHTYHSNQTEAFGSLGDTQSLLGEIVRKELVSFLSKRSICNHEKWVKLPSSGVSVRPYINIKRIFENEKLFRLVAFQMTVMVATQGGKAGNSLLECFSHLDKFVCVSHAGAVLATALGEICGKEVLYLMNLGPKASIRDRNIADLIEPQKKYLFVSDMLCMGTEYKLAKAVIHVNRARLDSGVAAVRHQYTEDVDSIISTHDYENEFKYEIRIDTAKEP